MAVRDSNGVPILAVSNSSEEFVRSEHEKALEALAEDDQSHLLTHTVVYLHNPKPTNSSTPDVTVFQIGGSTLHEALTEVVGGFEFHTHLERPEYVASTNENVAKLLAEHYGCDVKSVEDVSAPTKPTEEVY